MKLPQKPKSIKELQSALGGLRRMSEIMVAAESLTANTSYWHWDEVRRRPAPAGFTHDEWWLALKLGRRWNRRPLPLLDKTGMPFTFTIPDVVQEQLHEIDRGTGALISDTEPITNPQTRDRYLVRSLVEEAITSSQLEGAVTTRAIAKEMLNTGRSEQMILNNYVTMKRIMDIKEQSLTPELVLNLHHSVTELTLEHADAAGRLRRADEPVHVVNSEGEVFHTPPAAETLPERLRAMCDFANSRTPDYFIHPAVRAMILHFWLAYDHPFVDGNGRTARALFYWSMLHRGYWLFEFVSISQILLRSPTQYALAFLHSETDDNDLTYFLLHQSDVIRRAVQALHLYIERKAQETETLQGSLLYVPGLNHRQRDVLAYALRHPGASYSVAAHRGHHAVAYDTARTDLLDLAARHLLDKRKEGRGWLFIAPRDLNTMLKKNRGAG